MVYAKSEGCLTNNQKIQNFNFSNFISFFHFSTNFQNFKSIQRTQVSIFFQNSCTNEKSSPSASKWCYFHPFWTTFHFGPFWPILGHFCALFCALAHFRAIFTLSQYKRTKSECTPELHTKFQGLTPNTSHKRIAKPGGRRRRRRRRSTNVTKLVYDII